ncbi:hypothetical protein BDW71DRAFT_211994 [Aspergillus fruticulosus]
MPPTPASARKTLNSTTIAGLLTHTRPLCHALWTMEMERLNTSDQQTVDVGSIVGEAPIYNEDLAPAAHLRFTEKYVLREMIDPFVTEGIYKRTRQPELKELMTRESAKDLGFVDREDSRGDPLAFRAAITVAQYVVLCRGVGVKTAVAPVMA